MLSVEPYPSTWSGTTLEIPPERPDSTTNCWTSVSLTPRVDGGDWHLEIVGEFLSGEQPIDGDAMTRSCDSTLAAELTSMSVSRQHSTEARCERHR
jgi:hypothetical protein